jgi:transposase
VGRSQGIRHGRRGPASWRRSAPRLSAFVAVLGHSRGAHVESVADERLETLIACHQNAFAYFGGVPRQALYDNMRTVVVGRDAYGPGRHRLQPAFRDFAHHCSFVLRLCRPYQAKTMGKVERFIRYLRHSFLVPLETRLAQAGLMLDPGTANVEVRKWLRDVANRRVHASTGAVPAEVRYWRRSARPCSRCRNRGAAFSRSPTPGWWRLQCELRRCRCSTRCLSMTACWRRRWREGPAA